MSAYLTALLGDLQVPDLDYAGDDQAPYDRVAASLARAKALLAKETR